MVRQRTSTKRNDLLQLALSVVLLVLVGFASERFFVKFDLTEEKRHTLTPATLELLESLDDQVFIRCYLSGDHSNWSVHRYTNLHWNGDFLRSYTVLVKGMKSGSIIAGFLLLVDSLWATRLARAAYACYYCSALLIKNKTN